MASSSSGYSGSDLPVDSTDSEKDTVSEGDCDALNEIASEWLSDHFASISPVAIKFGTDDKKFFFPRELLVKYFKYFKLALQTNGNEPVFVEGNSDHVMHLKEIKAGAFSHMIQYLSNHDDHAYSNCDSSIDMLLEAIVTADYLGMDSPYGDFLFFEADIIGFLRTRLLGDHRKVKNKHLQLVETHSAFASGRVWTVLAQAGVRPYLQQYMLDPIFMQKKIAPQCPGDILPQPDEWLRTIKHHRKLRDRNERYALKVMEQVSNTLRQGRVNQHQNKNLAMLDWDAVIYKDPLYIGPKTGTKRKLTDLSREYHFTV